MRQRIWRSNVRPISLCSNGANVLLQRNIDRRDVLRPTEHARNVRSSVHLGSAVSHATVSKIEPSIGWV
jgi:hypothetical protein